MRPNLSSILPTTRSGAVDHERLTSLINSMADGVIAVDQKQRVVIYNGAALNILDVNSSMTGKQLLGLFKLVDKNKQEVNIQKLVYDAKTPVSYRDYLIEYPDKSTINLYLSIAPVHLGFGQRGERGYVLLLRDITREKSLEEERDEFISVVSHELRTPIAISEGNISNALLIAQKSNSSKQIIDALTQAHDQIIFLSDMINDLSTLSRAERGKLAVEVEPINIHELLQGLVNTYRPQAEQKGLQLNLELDPKLELLKSSKLYVREIIQNFVTNAIKYTEQGSVTMGAIAKEGGVEFYVRDTGIGISQGDKERVFDKFFRSEDFRTRKNNGTGLGLYVTMKLARLIHAELDLESELNKGSTFRIRIPDLNQE